MIIFNAAGRFGNQIFQFILCESVRHNKERVFSLGFANLFTYIQKPLGYYNIDNNSVNRFFDVIVRRVLLFLCKLKVIGLITEDHKKNTITMKGILPIRYIYGYFQTDEYILHRRIKFKTKYLLLAQDFFNAHKKQLHNCFIHVRHGDYTANMVLPTDYYLKALNTYKEKYNLQLESIHFFIFGDDIDWAKCFFQNLPFKTFCNNSMIIDFLTMISCEGGIISNSSFAWLAGFWCINKVPVIAPKYWTSQTQQRWEQEKLNTSKFDFI